MVRLPVSGNEVALRAPDGTDDILLQEASGGSVEVGIALLGRLGGANDWTGLSVTDFEFLLLHLRAQRFGEHLSLGFACPECGDRIEVSMCDRRTPRYAPIASNSHFDFSVCGKALSAVWRHDVRRAVGAVLTEVSVAASRRRE